MEKKIDELVRRYRHCSVVGNVLYMGRIGERIHISAIDDIEFFNDRAVLNSKIGTEFGYHEVIIRKDDIEFTEVLDDVVYYNFKR